MRTITPVLFVLALGTAALIWGMAGAGSIYGQSDPVSGMESGDAINESKNDSAVGGGNFSGEASASEGEGDIVGLIVSGISNVVGFAAMVGLLPWELQRLGFPSYFAFPIGFLAQGLVGIGIVQFATNRDFK